MKPAGKLVLGWSLYDAATSPFVTTAVGAVLPVYFHEVVMPPGGVTMFGAQWTAESLWGLLTGTGPLLLLLALPLLGALADRRRAKSRFLTIFTVTGATAASTLLFAGEGDVAFTAAVFLVAILSVGAAGVFYDGLLNDVATPDTLDRVSAQGMAFGFMAGAIHLIASLALIALWDDPLATPVAISSTGVWWAVVALVSFRLLRGVEQPLGSIPSGRFRASLHKTFRTARQVRQMPDLWKLVVAKMLYGNGVQTTVVMTAVYAAETLELGGTTVIVAFLLVQILSVFSTRAAARLAERWNIRTALTAILLGWIAAVAVAFFLPARQPLPFLGLAVVIGLVFGAVATLSRSLFASMVPPGESAEFFGYESLTSRFAVIWGPLAFTVARQATGSGRMAILTVVGFLLAGLIAFRRVDIERGRGTSLRVAGAVDSDLQRSPTT